MAQPSVIELQLCTLMKVDMKLQNKIICILLFSLLLLQCDNIFKHDDKKEKVRTLIDHYFMDIDIGRWIFYWDGKDDDGILVEPGRYIILLEIEDFQDQEYVTAEKGGKTDANNEAHFTVEYWMYHDLLEPYPNPFRVESGVNIPVIVAEPARVRVRIYKD